MVRKFSYSIILYFFEFKLNMSGLVYDCYGYSLNSIGNEVGVP